MRLCPRIADRLDDDGAQARVRSIGRRRAGARELEQILDQVIHARRVLGEPVERSRIRTAAHARGLDSQRDRPERIAQIVGNTPGERLELDGTSIEQLGVRRNEPRLTPHGADRDAAARDRRDNAERTECEREVPGFVAQPGDLERVSHGVLVVGRARDRLGMLVDLARARVRDPQRGDEGGEHGDQRQYQRPEDMHARACHTGAYRPSTRPASGGFLSRAGGTEALRQPRRRRCCSPERSGPRSCPCAAGTTWPSPRRSCQAGRTAHALASPSGTSRTVAYISPRFATASDGLGDLLALDLTRPLDVRIAQGLRERERVRGLDVPGQHDDLRARERAGGGAPYRSRGARARCRRRPAGRP